MICPLTKGLDTITGSTGNDTLNAVFGENGSTGAFDVATLNLLDTVDGGAGTDTLVIEGAQALQGTLSNIEIARYKGTITGLNSTATGNITVDSSKVGGLQQLWFDSVTTGRATAGKLIVSNLTTGQTVGVKGDMTADGTIAVVVDASYGATATAAALALDGVNGVSSATADTVAVNALGAGLKSLEVSGTTKKTTSVTGTVVLDDSSNNIETLTVKGGTQINLNAAALTGLKTIDLSGSTGETTLTSAAAGSTVTITGSAQKDTITHSADIGSATKLNVSTGAGNDKLSLTGTNVDFTGANVVLDGGEGTDTLQLVYADVADFVSTSKKATISGFETLGVTGAATTAQSVDASKLTAFSTVEWSGTNTGAAGVVATNTAGSTAIAVTKAQAAHTYSFASDVTGGAGTNGASIPGASAGKAVSFAMATDSAADTVSMSIGNAAATASTAVVTIKAGAANTTTATGVVAASSIDATDFETLNIASVGKQATTASTTTGAVTDANVIGGNSNTNSIVLGTNAKLVVTGVKDLDIVGAVAGTNLTIDASALTGGIRVTADGTNNVLKGGASNNTLNGGAGVDTLVGQGGKDLLIGGTGADTMTGGAGADVFQIANGDSTGTAFDKITDYQALASSGDTIKLTTASVAAAVTTPVNVSAATTDATDTITATVSSTGIISLGGSGAANVDTLAEWVAVALTAGVVNTGDAGTVAAKTAMFEFGGNSYVISVYDADGSDPVLSVAQMTELTGQVGLVGVSTTAAANTVLIAAI